MSDKTYLGLRLVGRVISCGEEIPAEARSGVSAKGRTYTRPAHFERTVILVGDRGYPATVIFSSVDAFHHVPELPLGVVVSVRASSVSVNSGTVLVRTDIDPLDVLAAVHLVEGF